ncbi:hypothetical protein ACF06L_30145 [Streptomyces sp. NPDC015408]
MGSIWMPVRSGFTEKRKPLVGPWQISTVGVGMPMPSGERVKPSPA